MAVFSCSHAVLLVALFSGYLGHVLCMVYSYDHETCRLPIQDRNRNYYLARLGGKSVACIRYGSVQPNSSTILAFGCERNSDGTSQLVLRPDMLAECTKGINANSAGKACNVISSEEEPDVFDKRRYLRLTGQPVDSNQGLDEVFVTDRSFICTETFGEYEKPVPTSVARRCDSGRLRIPSREMDSLYTTTPTYDCSKLVLHIPY